MRRDRSSVLVVGIAVTAAALLAACGGSSSSTKSNTPSSGTGNTAAAGTGGTSTSATRAATGAATSAATVAPTTSGDAATTAPATSQGSGSLPANACALLSDQEASSLAGSPVTGHQSGPITTLYAGGTSALCQYYGDNGTGDHPVHLFVTSFADSDALQKLFASRKKLSQTVGGADVDNIGDEAVAYKVGGAAEILIRDGSLFVELNAGSEDYPAPAMSALEDAARTVVGRLQ